MVVYSEVIGGKGVDVEESLAAKRPPGGSYPKSSLELAKAERNVIVNLNNVPARRPQTCIRRT